MSFSDKYNGPYVKDAVVVMFDLALDASFLRCSPQIIQREHHFGIRCMEVVVKKTKLDEGSSSGANSSVKCLLYKAGQKL